MGAPAPLPLALPAATMTARGFAFAVAALLLLAAIIGVSAIATLPPDEHEVLVLRTVEEMHARGDWVVPYFNGEPRLNKPPLSYWLTALSARAGGAGARVEAWHGRVPSVVAGLGMVMAIVLAGRRLYGARAACYAAGLFVTSAGYFSYVHDARPDFVYAFFCTLGLCSGAVGLLHGPRRPRLPIYGMWLSYGLATLGKGPQIPLLLLIGTFLFSWRRHGGRHGVRVLHPFGGILLLASVSVPWWLMLQQRLDPATVGASQLSGQLLVPHLTHALNGYYLYRPLQLVLPWLPLVPLAWVAALVRGEGRRDASVCLGFAVACVALGLSLGSQQRYFYMLPVLPAMCLLAGHGLERMASWRPRLAASVWVVQAVVVLVATAYVFYVRRAMPAYAVFVFAAAAAGIVIARLTPSAAAGIFAGTVLLAASTFAHSADSELFWSADRRNKHNLARSLPATVPADAVLVSLKLTPAVYVFEAGRRIPALDSPLQLRQTLAQQAAAEAYVLMPVAELPAVQDSFEVEPLRLMPEDADDRAGLYRVMLGVAWRSGGE